MGRRKDGRSEAWDYSEEEEGDVGHGGDERVSNERNVRVRWAADTWWWVRARGRRRRRQTRDVEPGGKTGGEMSDDRFSDRNFGSGGFRRIRASKGSKGKDVLSRTLSSTRLGGGEGK